MREEKKAGRIAIIPARSGSKGLKNKNILPLLGKPLLAYSIEAALKSRMFDRVFVSTDSKEYAAIAEEYGTKIPFLRSEDNSLDNSSVWDGVKEVIRLFEDMGECYDEIMLLQPTSPLRTDEDIIKSIELFENNNANSVLSLTEAEHSPLWMNTVSKNLCIDKFIIDEYWNTPRQELPVHYRISGAIYFFKKEELFKDRMFNDKCYAYIMPKDRSVDIDDEIDFKLAEYILANKEDQ